MCADNINYQQSSWQQPETTTITERSDAPASTFSVAISPQRDAHPWGVRQAAERGSGSLSDFASKSISNPIRTHRTEDERRQCTVNRLHARIWPHVPQDKLRTLFTITLFVLLGFAAGGTAAANEAFVTTAGGTAALRRAADTTVRMRAEYIDITLHDETYEVDALFVFDNPGPTATHEVGFPRFSAGIEHPESFRDFRSWVNDEPVEALEVPAAGGAADARSSNRDSRGERPSVSHSGARLSGENPAPRIESYYVRDVEFPRDELTTTRVRYTADYGRDRLFRTVRYLYGTGTTWAGTIDTMTIRIDNTRERWIDSFRFAADRPVAFSTRGATDFDLVKTDVDPPSDATFDLFLDRYAWWLQDPRSSDVSDDWIYDRVHVKQEYLRLLTLNQLRIFRNTFFARNGYDFGDSDLGRFFRHFRWYRPVTTSTAGLLNAIEEENVRLIRAEEDRRRTFVRD